MTSPIGTFAAQRLQLQNTLDVQSRAERLQIQLSSGKKAQNFEGISQDARRLLDLERSQTANKAFQQNVKQANLRLEETANVISDLETIASQYRSQLVSAATDTNVENLSIKSTAQNFLEEIEGLLNTDLAGRHLFSGTATDQKAVNLTDGNGNPRALDKIASGQFFNGNDSRIETRASENLSVESNVTADPTQRTGIQELVTAAARVANADSGNLKGAIDAAIDDLSGADVRKSANAPGFTATGTDTIDITTADGSNPSVSISSGDSLSTIAEKITDQADGVSARLEENTSGDIEIVLQSDGNTEITNVNTNATGVAAFDPPSEQAGAIERLAETSSDVGSRKKLFDDTLSRLESDASNNETAIGEIENVDVTKAASEMSALQNTLRASLAATSRLQNISILNYLR